MVKLSPPWITYCKKIEALFSKDSDMNILVNEDEPSVKLYVDDAKKAEALEKLLKPEVQFGNVTLKVFVIPANLKDDPASIVRAAFRNNEAVDEIIHLETPLSGSCEYVMFAPEVVQFFNDDMYDPNGLKTTLYQDIAKELFDIEGVHFCTAKK